MRPTAPILRLLTPAEPDPLPPGATVVDAALDGGLPEYLPLHADLGVFVVAVLGRADTWYDADPAAVVSTPADPGRTFRLMLRAGGAHAGALPLTAGARRTVELPGSPRLATEIAVLDWELRAGSVRGAGRHGSRIRLAWWDLGGAP
ncbi:hypothetical protein [Kitasatospora sp. NPDC008115]|uniref:hypothetical protein n=1 Tax=Kitasatospora sp. NPDC008115 TaxID=3364022 RepID=UPI0036E1FFB4